MTIPVTVAGGYLGAGKTTLVNHLLRHAGGMKLAVLVNEFGELPIDGDLIESIDDDVINIAGGCICCSYGSDLMGSLLDLAGRVPPPEHVLIEASGVALPGAIASSVRLLSQYEVDAVAVMADAANIERQSADHYLTDTIERQLLEADLVLLNKCDQVGPDQRETLRDWLQIRSPGARIVETTHGAVPAGLLLGARLHQGELGTSNVHAHFETFLMHPGPACDASALAKALAAPSLGLARAKGFVADAKGEIALLQVVGNSWSVTAAPAGVKSTGVVGIGVRERINQDRLREVHEAFGLELLEEKSS